MKNYFIMRVIHMKTLMKNFMQHEKKSEFLYDQRNKYSFVIPYHVYIGIIVFLINTSI